jgi:hypothetical protein
VLEFQMSNKMGTSKFKYVILNSTILFCVANILEMTLHEFGHFFASIMVDAKGISIHHNYVSNIDQGLPLKSILLIKAAGPLVSLIIGIVFHRVISKQKERDLNFLFNLYMAVFGYIGIFGYLMISPVFTGGDTGYICWALKFPLALTITIAISGAITLYLLIRNLMKYFVEMGTREIIEKKETRIPFIHSLILVPVILGMMVTTILNLPIVSTISLIAPVCSPFTLFWDYGNALFKKYDLKVTHDNFNKLNNFNLLLVVVLIVTIIYNRLLVIGIYYK